MLNVINIFKNAQLRFLLGNKTFYILFFVFASVFCNAQTNLVYNGDFEIYDTCPFSVATPGNYQVQHALGWTTPTYATSDYFNSCNGGTVVGVPDNFGGTQNAFNGNAYCGLIPFEHIENEWWFEYIQGKFIQPLEAGHTYNISFYVSCGEYASTVTVSKIGACISNIPITRSDALPFIVTPQILNGTGIISDTANWTEISGSYTALGNEQFITIGYFSDTIISASAHLQHIPSQLYSSSYYFVDDVSAIDISDQLDIANVFTPNNDGINDLFFITTLEEGDKYTIYNRWGIKVFEGSYNTGWEGRTRSGVICSDGVYYYITEQKGKQTKKGFIQLVR